MAGKSRSASRQQRIERQRLLAETAAQQHGVVSRCQLRKIGFSDSAIDRELEAQRLHRVFHAVYAYGNPNVGELGRLRAATLACGPGTVVSHRSAAALMGLVDRGPVVIDVIAAGSQGRGIDGIRPHGVIRPRRDEVGSFDSVPCTSPARVFVDLAGTVGTWRLRSGFERAAAQGMLDLGAIEAVLARGHRRGERALRALIAEWRRAAALAHRGRLKSPLEAKVLPIVLRDGTPAPRPNAPVRLVDGSTIEVDLLWEAERFVVETDSRGFHATDVAFERDRWRDRELLRAGYGSLRVTNRAAEDDAAAIADAIGAELRARNAHPGRGFT